MNQVVDFEENPSLGGIIAGSAETLLVEIAEPRVADFPPKSLIFLIFQFCRLDQPKKILFDSRVLNSNGLPILTITADSGLNLLLLEHLLSCHNGASRQDPRLIFFSHLVADKPPFKEYIYTGGQGVALEQVASFLEGHDLALPGERLDVLGFDEDVEAVCQDRHYFVSDIEGVTVLGLLEPQLGQSEHLAVLVGLD
jgi:hypothetical protein